MRYFFLKNIRFTVRKVGIYEMKLNFSEGDIPHFPFLEL